jgi:prepilin-type N-terminal cleavage/methylation domain-containing protein
MKKGFTLLEMFIVIVIIASLAGLIAPFIIQQSDEYRAAKAEEMWFVPETPPADPQKEIVDQLKKQNELLERQLKIQEAALPAEKQ